MFSKSLLTRKQFEFFLPKDYLGLFLLKPKQCGGGRWPARNNNSCVVFWLLGMVFIFLNLPHQFSASCQTEKREREREREREIERGGREREGQKYTNVMNFEVTMMFYYRNTAVPVRSQMPKPRIVELVWCRPIWKTLRGYYETSSESKHARFGVRW